MIQINDQLSLKFFNKLSNNHANEDYRNYFLYDADEDKVNMHIKNITKINDLIEELLKEKEFLETENRTFKKVMIQNKELLRENSEVFFLRLK